MGDYATHFVTMHYLLFIPVV